MGKVKRSVSHKRKKAMNIMQSCVRLRDLFLGWIVEHRKHNIRSLPLVADSPSVLNHLCQTQNSVVLPATLHRVFLESTTLHLHAFSRIMANIDTLHLMLIILSLTLFPSSSGNQIHPSPLSRSVFSFFVFFQKNNKAGHRHCR